MLPSLKPRLVHSPLLADRDSRPQKVFPIHQLPTEIFLAILLYASAVQIDAYTEEDFEIGCSVVRLALVCRHWRDIIWKTPDFWRTIVLNTQEEWVKIALSRSADMTLDILFHAFDKHVESLLPHAHRIRSMRFRYPPWSAEVHMLVSLLADCRSLELLEFEYPMTDMHPPNFIDLQITSDRHPSLRHLSLCRFDYPRDQQIYTQLRSLKLRWEAHNMSITGFLQALSQCHNLEDLELDKFLGEFPAIQWPTEPRHPPISFRSMISLCLYDDATPVSRFLMHLALPRTTSISIIRHKPTSPDTYNQIVGVLPTNWRVALPIISDVTNIRIKFSDGWVHLSCFNETRDTSFELSFIAMGLPEDVGILEQLPNIFHPSRLTELSIDTADVTFPSFWGANFRAFNSLEKLSLDGAQLLTRSTCDGLMAASVATGDREAAEPIACPRLRYIRLRHKGHKHPGAEFFEGLVECLRIRADRGARLELLFIVEAFGQDREFMGTYVHQLREVATRVEYRDVGDEDVSAWDSL